MNERPGDEIRFQKTANQRPLEIAVLGDWRKTGQSQYHINQHLSTYINYYSNINILTLIKQKEWVGNLIV
jgi:hypothetical protein